MPAAEQPLERPEERAGAALPRGASGLGLGRYPGHRRRLGLLREGSGEPARRSRPRTQAELTQAVRIEGVKPLQAVHDPPVLGDALRLESLAAMGRLRQLGLEE